MAPKTRSLLDTVNGIYTDSLDLNEVYNGPEGAISFRVTKRRLRGGNRDGVDMIEVDNGKLSFIIITTRGMSIWRARCKDVELKWDSPVQGPVHPRYVPIHDPSGLGFLEGFDEWFVRCGLESNGAPEFNEYGVLKYPLHGRIANTPARRVKVIVDPETGEITISAIIDEQRLFGKRLTLGVTYTTFAGSSELFVKDTVTNLAATDGEFELLYHINTGMPFAAPGSKVMFPFQKMSPRNQESALRLQKESWDLIGEEQPGLPEVVYFFEPAVDRNGIAKALLINAKGNRGLTVSFKKEQFPCFSLWKSEQVNGDGFVTGLEPAVNFPNTKSFEKSKGRVISLKPGESRDFELRLGVLHDPNSIADQVHYIQRVQSLTTPTIRETPDPHWSEEV